MYGIRIRDICSARKTKKEEEKDNEHEEKEEDHFCMEKKKKSRGLGRAGIQKKRN